MLGLSVDLGLERLRGVGRSGSPERELELAQRRLGEAELELARRVLRGLALAPAHSVGPASPSRDLLLDNGTSGSECQAPKLGVELRDCIGELGPTS